MGHIMDRDDRLGREMGLCTAPDHRGRGCQYAHSLDLAEQLGDALARLSEIANLADDAFRAWHDWPGDPTTEHGDHHEPARLAEVARAARIAAGDVNPDPSIRHADDNL